MPTPAFAGVQTSQILSPKFSLIKIANEGFPFTNAVSSYESQQIFIREPASLTIKSFGDEDVVKRNLIHGYAVDAKVGVLQTTWAELLNWYKLSGARVQAAFTQSGFTYNFVDNAGGQDGVGGSNAATGSSLLGLLPTYTVDDKKSIIDLELKGELWDGEYEWMIDVTNSAAVATGGSSGSTLGLTATTDNRANNLRGGIVDVTWAGVSLGVRKQGSKFELKGVASATDHKDRPTAAFFDGTLEVVCRQMKADLKAAWYAGQNDGILLVTLANGNTIKFDAGAYGLMSESTVDEKDSFVKYTFGGRYSRNTDEASPNSIDIGVGTATQLELKKLY